MLIAGTLMATVLAGAFYGTSGLTRQKWTDTALAHNII